jgi:hypothetical protein
VEEERRKKEEEMFILLHKVFLSDTKTPSFNLSKPSKINRKDCKNKMFL